jgi:hypothetical protein
VEACKSSLTTNQDLQSSVDWLTEVIHRFTDAYMKGNAPSTVNMDVLMHAEKVSDLLGFGCILDSFETLKVEKVRVKIHRQSMDSSGNGSF